MSRRARKVPSYCLHKASGKAVVRLDGRDVYLGKHGSPESHEKYERAIAEWRIGHNGSAVSPGRSIAPNPENTVLTVNQVILAFWQHAETYYAKDGKPTRELAHYRIALKWLRRVYGRTPASEFGPLALKAIRQKRVECTSKKTKERLSRRYINQQIDRIKRVFKWAVSEELVRPSVYQGLSTVRGLQYGRTNARETEPVRPVDDGDVRAVLPFMSPVVAAMVRLERITGMRPGEVVIMRPCEIDQHRYDDVWVYEPLDHKNRWRGHLRRIPLGPKAQEIIKPFLDRPHADFLFSPRESEEWRLRHRPPYNGRGRQTPVYPSELRRREAASRASRRRKRKQPLRHHYTTSSYRRAVRYAIEKAARHGVQVEQWFPNQLRHTRGTEVRRDYRLEGSRVILGEASVNVTEHYAEENFELARQIATETG